MPIHGPLQRGDEVLVPFPFADLSGSKVRPATIVSADPQGPELTIAFITSVLTNRSPRGAEVEVAPTDPEFQATGLKTGSLIRMDKLVTRSRAGFSRRLGTTGPSTQAILSAMLRVAFGLYCRRPAWTARVTGVFLLLRERGSGRSIRHCECIASD